MAMTDAQRQQKRREKIKKQATQARFDPLPYLGQALAELVKTGRVDKALCAEIQSRALELFIDKQQDSFEGPANQVLMQRYFSTLLSDLLSQKE